MISALDNIKNLCYNYIIDKGGFQYMNYSEKILSSIQTIAKSQDKNFDRTIQAIVLDNSDTEQKGEIKVQYQDAILKVYCDIGDVRKYPKGSNIYVTIPNGNMSARKTILGLVESIGALEVQNYLDTLVTELILLGQSNEQNIEILDNTDFTNDREDEGKILDSQILELINQADYVKMSAKVFSSIDKAAYPLDQADFGLRLDLYSVSEESPTHIYFNTNTFQGNPFSLPETTQVIVFNPNDFKNNNEFFSKVELVYYRKNFNFLQSNSQLSNLIKITNITFESVYEEKPIETKGSALYIIAPKGTCFSKKITNEDYIESIQKDESVVVPQDKLILQAAVKVNGVQVDNSSLKCNWFAMTRTNKSTEEEDQSATQDWSPFDKGNTSNQIEISRSDLNGATERQFKVIGLYQGIELEATINIQDLNVEPKCTFEQDGNKYLVNLEDFNNSKQEFYKAIWYLSIGAGNRYLLGTIDENLEFKNSEYSYLLKAQGNIKEYSESQFYIQIDSEKVINAGTIYCEIYYKQINEGVKIVIENPYKIFSASYNGQIPTDNYYIENGEQVFLQDIEGHMYENTEENISDPNKMNYIFKPRQLKLVGPTKNKTIKWYINNDVVAQGSIFNLESYLDFSSNIINKKITNIKVEIETESGIETIYPNISYITEGDNGTNGTGYYVRIVPNISYFSTRNSYITPLVIFEYDSNFNIVKYRLNYDPEDNRGVASSDNTLKGIYPFKIQIWENNNLVFDGVKSNQDFFVRWGKTEDVQSSYLSKILSYGKFLANKSGKLDTYKNQPAYVYATYKGITAALPVCCAFVEEGSKISDFIWDKNNQLFYYYDENGSLTDDQKEEEFSLFKNISFVSPNIEDTKSLIFSLDNSLSNNFTIIENGKFKQNENYGGDGKLDSFIYVGQDKKEMIDEKDEKYYIDTTFLNIPLKAMIKSAFSSLLVNWSGKQAVFSENDNYAAAEKIYAGTRDTDNSFSGVVLGQKDSDENGIIVYNQNNRTFYIDKTGKITIGQDYDSRLTINPKEHIVSSLGFSFDYVEGSIETDSFSFKDTEKPPITVKQENKTKFQLQNDGTLGLTTAYTLYDKTDTDIFGGKNEWIFYKYNESKQIDGFDYNTDKISRYGDFYLDNQGRLATTFLYIGKGETSREGVLGNSWFINKDMIAYNTLNASGDRKGVYLDGRSGLTISSGENGVNRVTQSEGMLSTKGFYAGGGATSADNATWGYTATGIRKDDKVFITNTEMKIQYGSNFLSIGSTSEQLPKMNNLKIENSLSVNSLNVTDSATISNAYLSGDAIGSNDIQAGSVSVRDGGQYHIWADGDWQHGKSYDVPIYGENNQLKETLHFRGGILVNKTQA